MSEVVCTSSCYTMRKVGKDRHGNHFATLITRALQVITSEWPNSPLITRSPERGTGALIQYYPAGYYTQQPLMDWDLIYGAFKGPRTRFQRKIKQGAVLIFGKDRYNLAVSLRAWPRRKWPQSYLYAFCGHRVTKKKTNSGVSWTVTAIMTEQHRTWRRALFYLRVCRTLEIKVFGVICPPPPTPAPFSTFCLSHSPRSPVAVLVVWLAVFVNWGWEQDPSRFLW